MSDDWDFYMLRVDDKPASIMVDLGIKNIAPISTHPNALYLRLFMNNPQENGLSSQAEFDRLCEVEDAIKDQLQSESLQHLYVGRNTNDGKRDFFFYTGQKDDLRQNLSKVTHKFEEYNFEMGGREDIEWDTYNNFLYPNPRQIQNIMNRRVCYQLEQEGDDLSKPREIDHRVYFKKKSNLQKYAQFIKNLNHKITHIGRERPFVGRHLIDFKRIDVPADVDAVVDDLFLKSVELDGVYDGWGCTVVTE